MRIFHFGALLPAAPHFLAFSPSSTRRRFFNTRVFPSGQTLLQGAQARIGSHRVRQKYFYTIMMFAVT